MVKKSAVIKALKQRGQELYAIILLFMVPIIAPSLIEKFL